MPFILQEIDRWPIASLWISGRVVIVQSYVHFLGAFDSTIQPLLIGKNSWSCASIRRFLIQSKGGSLPLKTDGR